MDEVWWGHLCHALLSLWSQVPPQSKIECFQETFHKLKWYNMNEQLPLISMEKFLSFPRLQIQYTCNVFFSHSPPKHLITSRLMISITPFCVDALLFFSGTLEHILLTDAQINWYKTQMLTDTVQSSGAWCCDEIYLFLFFNLVPGEGVRLRHYPFPGVDCLYKVLLQKNVYHYFHFLPFFVKAQFPFRLFFLFFSFWLAKIDTNVVFHKSKVV